MPRRKGIPAYRRHICGQARVRINGRDHYLGPYGSPESEAEYDRLVKKLLVDRALARIGEAGDLVIRHDGPIATSGLPISG